MTRRPVEARCPACGRRMIEGTTRCACDYRVTPPPAAVLRYGSAVARANRLRLEIAEQRANRTRAETSYQGPEVTPSRAAPEVARFAPKVPP